MQNMSNVPVYIYLLKVRAKLKQGHWRRSGVFIVNVLQTYFAFCFSASIVNFEHVIAGWGCSNSENVRHSKSPLLKLRAV